MSVLPTMNERRWFLIIGLFFVWGCWNNGVQAVHLASFAAVEFAVCAIATVGCAVVAVLFVGMATEHTSVSPRKD